MKCLLQGKIFQDETSSFCFRYNNLDKYSKVMKKSVFLLFTFCVALYSCSKNDSPENSTPASNSGGNSNTTNVSAVPATFTQKVLLEIFTGAGQPQCTDGTAKLNEIMNANSSKAIAACVHYSDGMETPMYTFMETNFNNGVSPAFPSGMVNRIPSTGITILNRTQWLSNFNLNKSKVAKCGLAIKSTINGTTATIEAHAGFNQTMTGSYNLSVYLIENNVTGTGNQYDQRNSYNTVSGHAFYQAGDPIIGFEHNCVLRKVLSSNLGDGINASNITAGGKDVKTYTTSIAGYKSNDLYVIAFVNKVGATSTTHEIMNVQQVKLGSTKDWD